MQEWTSVGWLLVVIGSNLILMVLLLRHLSMEDGDLWQEIGKVRPEVQEQVTLLLLLVQHKRKL